MALFYDVSKHTTEVNKAVSKAIERAIQSGATPDQMIKAAQQELRKQANYASTRARTNTTMTENEARDEAYREMWEHGVEVLKIWVHTGGSKEPRHNHIAMDGEDQLVDQPFSNGGMYPADPDLPAEERCNCRCRTRPEIFNRDELRKVQHLAKSRDMRVGNKNIRRLIREVRKTY